MNIRSAMACRRIAEICLLVLGVGACSPGAQGQRHLERADRFYEEKQYSEAVIEYLNVLKGNSSNVLAIARIGIAYFEQGSYQQAAPYLVKAAELDPANPEVRLRLARVYAMGGQHEKARAEAAAVLEKDPGNLDALVAWAGSASTADTVEETLTRLQAEQERFGDKARFHITLGSVHFKRRAFAEAEASYRKAVEIEPGLVDAQLVLADFLMMKRSVTEAEEHYKKAVELSPVASVARVKWSGFLLQTGKRDEAKAVLQEIVAVDPNYIPALLGQAEFAFAEKRFDESLELAGRILKLEPAHLQALILRGKSRIAKGDTDRAVEEFEKLIQLYPGQAALHYHLATALVRKGNAMKAIDHLTIALSVQPDFLEAAYLMAEVQVRTGKPDDAIDFLEKLVQDRPELARAYIILGTAYRARGMSDRALQAYRKLGELEPKSPQAPYLQGLVLRSQSKRDEARQAFLKALEIMPDFSLAVANLVSVDVDDKKFDAALARVDAEIQRRPEVADFVYLRAKVLVVKGDREAAEQALLKTIEMQPRMAAAYIELGRLYAQGGEKDKAVAKMDEVLKVNPNNIAALMMGGTLYQEFGDYEKARDYYERILTANPKFVPALNNLAYIYSEQMKNPDRAFELAQQARELAPEDPYVADTLGWIVYQRGDFKWAATLIQEAADSANQNGEVLYHLGMARLGLGDESAALAAFQEAAAMEKAFVGQARARDLAEMMAIDPANVDEATRQKLDLLIAREPDLPTPQVKLALVEWRAGNTDEARQVLEKVAAKHPGYVPALAYLAEYHEAVAGDHAKALDLARKARALVPTDPRIAGLLGWVAFQAGDHEWASGLLADAAAKLPDDPIVQYRAGMARYAVGRVDEARETIKRAMALSPDFPGAADAGLLLEMLDVAARPDAAARVAEVVKEHPDFVPALVADAELAVAAKNLDVARARYEQSLEIYPSFGPALKGLVELYGAQKVADDKAGKVARKARELFPHDASVAGAAGTIEFLRGDDRALALLSEGVRATPDSAVLQRYLGLALMKSGDKAGAKAALERAVQLDPQLSSDEDVRVALDAAQK